MSIEAHMNKHYGLATRAQARDQGVSENRIRYLVRSGQWIRVHRSVFRHAATPTTWRQAVLAATLATDGVASHHTVIRLLDLDPTKGQLQSPIEITTDHRAPKRKLPGAVTHRSTQWSARQQTDFFGIRCTGIERTVMDVGYGRSPAVLERIAEQAVRRQLTSFHRLARFLVLHGRQGRTGSETLRAMLLRRDPAASLPLSDFSRAVAQTLDDANLPPPVLEFPIHRHDGTFIMQADLAWPSLRKVVELDGLAWHFGRDDTERDRRKRAQARAEGWHIQEVLWSMYRDNRASLTSLLARFLAS